VIYDLIVVGNGLAAQTFLMELFGHIGLNDKKYQNFSVAQVFSEETAPACSLRTTASVSLSGIAPGVSELGDDLRKSFFLFEDFVAKERPESVEAIKQYISYSTLAEKEKLIRRYGELIPIHSPLFKTDMSGTTLDSYIVDPLIHAEWFNKKIASQKIVLKNNFLKAMSKNEDGTFSCELMSAEILTARKIILCTGAYARIFSQFYALTAQLQNTQVVAGSYLQKTINLGCPSFYVTIDGHNLIYRSATCQLIMGSASYKGAFLAPDFAELNKIYQVFSNALRPALGSFEDFKTITGLRHKAQKRKPLACALNDEKSVYVISGFYKNGFSVSHLCAKKIVGEIFNS
jgi:hypothetical protein